MLKYTANSFYHEFLASANGCGIEACKCPVINDGQPQKSPNGIETAKSPPLGPFIYYVITFLGFLDPPPPLRNHVFST